MSLGSGIFSSARASKPHLMKPQGGVAAEIFELRADIKADFAANAAIAVEEFTNPIGAGAALISAAAATQVAAGRSATLLALAANISPPRPISVTTGGTTAQAAASALITGKDVNGNVLTETLTPSTSAATVTGSKCFASVSSIVEGAAGGTAATLSYGIGAAIGLGKPIKSRAGIASLIKEHANGAVVANGVIVAAATAVPNGSYAPNTAADGTKSYAVYYEYDATLNKDA
jgi:hypothetical protein